MANRLTIPKNISADPAVNQRLLYKEGLNYVQSLAKKIWTDYNIHDPGITILELLCYAITDLSYRASFPVPDILAKDTETQDFSDQFFTAGKILPSCPLTINDFRKILIDIEGIRNAWIVKVDKHIFADCDNLILTDRLPEGISEDPDSFKVISLEGFYDILLEPDPGADPEIVKKAIQVLNKKRNLCELFQDISIIKPEKYNLCAEIEIQEASSEEEVAARVGFKIQQYLSPLIRFRCLSEMYELGFTTDEIFEGPLLNHGFITDEDLENTNLRKEIYLSDIISIIMDIPGVKAVKYIRFNSEYDLTAPENIWKFTVGNNRKPELDMDVMLKMTKFFKGITPVNANKSKVKTRYQELMDEEYNKNEDVVTEDIPIPGGTYREIESHISMTNHFPLAWGIGPAGLPAEANVERKAKSKQLKAYLLFFDQLLANYLSQLNHTRELLSFNYKNTKTYFSQVVTSMTGYDEIYEDYTVVSGQMDNFFNNDSGIRRNRLLDHLVARFAENFSSYAYINYSAFDTDPLTMIEDKSDFLVNYPKISACRMTAYNMTAKDTLWNSDENLSGLERRIACLLGIHNMKRRNLADINYEVYNEIDTDSKDEYRFRVVHHITKKILISSSTRYKTRELALIEMRKAVNRGFLRNGYQVLTTGEEIPRYYFNIVDEKNNVIARRIEYYKTQELAGQAIHYLMNYLQKVYSDEGLFMLENILLLPETNKQDFIKPCLEPPCEETESLDPYSYRVHFVLPAYSYRFREMKFRTFAETLIRSETPAHILTRICWISREQMLDFEKLFKEWLEMKAGIKKTDPDKLHNDFLLLLSQLKNVYPESLLTACTTEDEEEIRFILNNSSLGNLNSDEIKTK